MTQPASKQPPMEKYLHGGPVVEPTARRVRVRFGGETIADSTRALLLRQYRPGPATGDPFLLPTYYFPQADVRMDLLERAGHDAWDGGTARWAVRVGDRVADDAASTLLAPPPDRAALAGHLTFTWGAMDAWFEEEEEIYCHARDPYKRVDALRSARHVRIAIAGETVAESRRPIMLFETSLPTRYYLPPEDVRIDLLERSGTASRCPLKGIAAYWSARIGGRVERDIAWGYPDPIPECPKIRGLLCFFDERVDLYVDGERQERPQTPWSNDTLGG